MIFCIIYLTLPSKSTMWRPSAVGIKKLKEVTLTRASIIGKHRIFIKE